MEELIIVKQLPIIKENLKKLSEEIDLKVNNATNLICSEETVKEVKKVRAELSNKFKELETQRKIVKNKILEPYAKFEETYSNYVSDKFKNADVILKEKIDNVENEIKSTILEKLKIYFEEYRISKNIDESYLSFEELNINITLGLLTEKKELTKKAKEEVIQKVDSIAKDIETINSIEDSNEILVEYLKSKDFSSAIKTVNDRHATLNLISQKEEQKKEIIEKEQEVIEKVEVVLQAPREEKEEIFEFHFKVRCSKEQAKRLKEFLNIGGYDYE